jgi:hypothetical protein
MTSKDFTVELPASWLYQTLPVDSGQIRLLRLRGAYDSGNDITLTGDLEVIRLKQPKSDGPPEHGLLNSKLPKFSTLSYV